MQLANMLTTSNAVDTMVQLTGKIIPLFFGRIWMHAWRVFGLMSIVQRLSSLYMPVMTRYPGAKMALERMILCLKSLHMCSMLVRVVCITLHNFRYTCSLSSYICNSPVKIRRASKTL